MMLISNLAIFALPSVRVLLALLFVFVALVSAGITGSSLSQGLIYSGVLENQTSLLFGTKPRAIRSDEWLVFTPMAIGQLKHQPPFPVINENLGPDGQNMLVVGMTGVPVVHISTIGKPATWGFFFLGLKQALAWYWWLPIFGSLLSLWGVIYAAFKVNWLPGLGLASLIVLSPYMTGWSYWPAYTVMFPSLALLSVLKIFWSDKLYFRLFWAISLVVALTGFFLVLYPAWQIPLAYLYTSIFFAIFIRDRLWVNWSREKSFLILAVVLISLTIIFLWWVDAKEAIVSMTQTIYPGQRSEVRGGDVPGWFLVKGLIAPWTMFVDIPGTNQSESASLFYFFVPLLALFVLVLRYPNRALILPLSILVFIVVVLLYQYYGFEQLLAKYSLWGRTTGKRSDLALGVAQYLFLASMMGYLSNKNVCKLAMPSEIMAWCVAIFTAILTLYWTSILPLDWVKNPSFRCAQFVALFTSGVGAYFLITKQFKLFVLLIISPSLLVAIAFNPVLVGPKTIVPLPVLDSAGQVSSSSVLNAQGRVLVVGSQVPAMMLFASGVPVLNGVHYYPQSTIWRTLDPLGSDINLYNRYQHLIFFVQDIPGVRAHKIINPSLDVVHVVLDGKRFNFSTLPVRQILVNPSDEEHLRENKSLQYVGKVGAMILFRIVEQVGVT